MAKKREDGLKSFRDSIAEVNRLFAALSKKLTDFRKEGASSEEVVSALGGEMEKLADKQKKLTDSLIIQQRSFKKGSEDYKSATTAIKGLTNGMDSLDRKYKTATKTTDGFIQSFRKQFSGEALGRSVGQLTKYLGVYKIFTLALSALKNVTVEAAKAAIEFEAQLARLSAVTGATGKNLESLSQTVFNVAGNTKFTTAEIIQLQTELGKLGFSVQEINASTQAIANVAQALGEQVGPVAQKVGQILNQFNLTAAESVVVGDVLVSTINNSALSFESFGTAIQYVGPLAAELGTSFVELSGAMAILADNGFTASRIGTGLRGVLTELGSTGQDLESIVLELAEAEISFSEAIDLVGKRSAAQLLTLVDNVEVLQDAENLYLDTGAAILASARQIDTFRGNTELLNSAWNAFLVNLGDFVTRTNFVKGALRILDSEAADTAEGLEAISQVSAEVLAGGISGAVSEFEKLNKESADFDANLTSAKTVAVNTISGEILKTDKKMLALLERKVEYENQSADAIGRKNRLESVNKKIRDLELETRQDVANALDEELDKQILISKAQIERNKINDEYKDTYEALNDIAEKEKITAEEAAKQRKDVDEVINELREKREKLNEGELSSLRRKRDFGLELSSEENLRLLTLEAQAEAYDTQISKFKNLFVEADKVKKADKEKAKTFDDEIDNLERQIEYQKTILANRLETNKLQREALENQLEAAKTEEERQEVLERIKKLERSSLNSQVNTYQTVNGLVQKYKDKLAEAGLTAEETAKAAKKLESIELAVAKLDIGIKDFAKVAKRLAKDFKKTFGEQLKEGKELTEEQQAFVDNYVAGLIEGFENLTPEQKKAINEVISSGLFAADTELEFVEELKKKLPEILGELQEVFEAYNETYLENRKATLEADLDAVKRKFSIEQDILKSQLDNQLITESQFRTKSLELQKSQLAEENTIKKQIFDAEKNSDLRIVAAETAEALASNILQNYKNYDFTTAGLLSILSTAAVLGAGVAKADAIRRRQFVPAKFEEGGMVHGPSHAEGGVPFTVQGQGGYEMEGGEFIVNKRATAMNKNLLERINNSHRVSPSTGAYKFASGGMVNAKADESVDYLKAIAEATTSTAIQSQKPVRAFVSGKDLRSNETERRLRDRNDRI